VECFSHDIASILSGENGLLLLKCLNGTSHGLVFLRKAFNNQEEKMKKYKDIVAFPHYSSSMEGMSYRQWLVGKVFEGVCGRSLSTKLSPNDIAHWGLAIVNDIETLEERRKS